MTVEGSISVAESCGDIVEVIVFDSDFKDEGKDDEKLSCEAGSEVTLVE